MTCEEFWEKDYRLVESYIKKQNMDIERETAWSWEIVQYIRAVANEAVVLAHGDKNAKKEVDKIFPKKSIARSKLGILNEKRDELISQEINNKIQEKIQNLNKKKGESNGDD